MSRGRFQDRLDYQLGNTVNEIFLKIPGPEARELFHRIEETALRMEVSYEADDGRILPIPILARPRVITRKQRDYFHRVCLEVNKALEKLAALYVESPEIRDLLAFTEEEDGWLHDIWPRVAKARQTIFGRLDTNVDLAILNWDENFQFFEANSIGVGGIYYTWATEKILMDEVAPYLQRVAPGLILTPNDDPRFLLLQQITAHARAIGRRRLNVALVQDLSSPGGPDEFGHLVRFLAGHGLTAVHCDPKDLEVRGDDLYARDFPVDIVYRDAEIAEYVRREAAGQDMRAMKRAFEHNQVLSTLSGEFDHKSVWEIFTDPAFEGCFTQRQWRIFRKHILWTRIVREGRATEPDGQMVDLVPWLRRNKDRIVLKPNREFGGTGIVIGKFTDLDDWDLAIQAALILPKSMVAQSYVDVWIKDFPVLTKDGITLEEFYVVCGFYATPQGLGILGRASKKRIVNVAKQGGMTAVLLLV